MSYDYIQMNGFRLSRVPLNPVYDISTFSPNLTRGRKKVAHRWCARIYSSRSSVHYGLRMLKRIGMTTMMCYIHNRKVPYGHFGFKYNTPHGTITTVYTVYERLTARTSVYYI